MELNESLFRITPESLKTVNVDLASGKSLSMVDLEMPVSTEHKGIITSELVRIHNRASSYGLNGVVQDFLCSYISQNLDLDNPSPLKDAEDRDLVPGTPASLPFALSPEVGLISFDLSLKERITVHTIGCDRYTDELECLQDRGIGYPHLQRRLPCRDLQLKEFDEPQPVPAGDVELANPSPGEVSKLISTLTTAIPSTPDSVDFSASTSCAENTVVFLTQPPEIPLCIFLSLYKEFE